MTHRTALGAAALSTVAALGIAPATQAAPAASTPTGVTVAWQGDKVRVTWNDDAASNWVYVSTEGGDNSSGTEVAPGEPKEVLLDTSSFRKGKTDVRVCVRSGDSNDPDAPTACSAQFDTLLGPWTKITGATTSYSGKVTFDWKPGGPVDDPNPGDPLDTSTPPKYYLGQMQNLPQDSGFYPTDVEVTSRTVTLPDVRVGNDPTKYYVSTQNEWGKTATVLRTPPSWVNVVDPELEAGVPPSGVYHRPMDVGFRYGPLEEPLEPGVGAPSERKDLVGVQTASSASGPWQLVRSTTDLDTSYDPNGETPAYSLSTTVNGPKYYRTVSRAWSSVESWGAYVQLGRTTPARHSEVDAWIRSARFLDPTVSGAQKAVAHLWVTPAFDGTVRLQRWDGSTWKNVADVPITDGVAQYRMAGPKGKSTWRYAISARTAPDGTPVSWTATTGFSMVRG